MDDFTRRARQILSEYAPVEAKRLGHKFLSNEHILLGMIRAENFQFLKELVVGSIFSRLKVDAKRLATEIEKRIEPDRSRQSDGQMSGGAVQAIIYAARKEARQFDLAYVGSEHVLFALLQDETGIASATLAEFGVNYRVVRNELRAMHG